MLTNFNIVLFVSLLRSAVSSPAINRLSSASRASRGVTGLGGCGTGIGLSTLVHHDLETDISALGVLVEGLTGVLSGAIRGVSLESLEGVEVHGSTGGVGVPGIVDVLLGLVVPKLNLQLAKGKQMLE